MLANPMDVLTAFPIRKSKKQKQAFRDAVQSYATLLGYEVTVEKGNFGSRNLIIGSPGNAQYLITAHYDTCAHLPFPNFITPCNPVMFILYQLFTVAVMFAFTAVGGVVAYLLTSDGLIAYWTACALLWVFIIMMMVGPANRQNANDNTSGVVTLLEIVRTLPEDQQKKVCFVLFDLEEAGLIGSASYRNEHKQEIRNQIILNLDCVGDGDEILLLPTGKLRKDGGKMEFLRTCVGTYGDKSIALHEKGFSMYPSDQANFPYGVGIAALRRNWTGLYLSRIHTNRDTILEESNVNILRAALIRLVCSNAAE